MSEKQCRKVGVASANDKRQAIKQKNRQLHKKFLRSGKARTAIVSVVVVLILYVFGALGFIELEEHKIDSILSSVESISDQITSIKEMISSSDGEEESEDEEADDAYEEDSYEEESQSTDEENEQQFDQLDEE